MKSLMCRAVSSENFRAPRWLSWNATIDWFVT